MQYLTIMYGGEEVNVSIPLSFYVKNGVSGINEIHCRKAEASAPVSYNGEKHIQFFYLGQKYWEFIYYSLLV